jgi:hypothetical protein
MDLLKKYWDKILLAVTLVGLIVVAVWLMISVESTLKQMGDGQLYRAPKGTIEPVDTTPITQARERIANPVLCELKGLPFGPTETPVAPTGEVVRVVEPGKISLTKVQRVPFQMIFKGYNWDDAKKEANSFQVNIQYRTRSFIVPRLGDYVQDLFSNTGYKAIKFERKEALVERPGIVGKVMTDVSELTLQHEGEDAIIMPVNRSVVKGEPVAHVVCEPGWPSVRSEHQVRRGQQFKCGGTVYIVVDINSRQMIIKDTKSEETTTVPLRSGGAEESR